MTVIWKDSLFDNPSHPYQGYVVQPYQLSDSVGNVNVDFKNGDNNQYIYGQRTLSGNLGDKWNLALSDNNSFNLADTTSSQNQTIQNIIDQLKEQYSFNSIIVSTPVSGEFADTTPIPTVTYTFSTKSQPVNASPVTVKYMDEATIKLPTIKSSRAPLTLRMMLLFHHTRLIRLPRIIRLINWTQLSFQPMSRGSSGFSQSLLLTITIRNKRQHHRIRQHRLTQLIRLIQ